VGGIAQKILPKFRARTPYPLPSVMPRITGGSARGEGYALFLFYRRLTDDQENKDIEELEHEIERLRYDLILTQRALDKTLDDFVTMKDRAEKAEEDARAREKLL